MRVLKNLFGNNSKIHESNIAVGNNEKQRSLINVVSSPANVDLSTWLLDYVEKDEFLHFITNSNAQNLPRTDSEWRYAFGIAGKRGGEIFILLMSNNGRMATKIYRSNTWTNWRIFE